MSTYRYAATSVLTGQLLWDDLPLKVSQCSRVINGVGQLSGYLDLQANTALNRTYVNALTPRRTFLWVLQDGFPVWVGRVMDTPHRSVLDNQLPIIAKTPESMFANRRITGALAFVDMDLFDIARGLIRYGTDPRLGPNAQIAQLNLSGGMAGATDTITFGTSNTLTSSVNTFYGTYSDYQPVLDALTSEAASAGFEFTIEPQVTSMGNYAMLLRLGYPALGQGTATQTLMFPGQVLDYARPIMGSNAANYIIGTSASAAGTTFTSQSPHGIDSADLAAGFPLDQTSISWPGAGVTSQAQINAYVDQQLGAYTAGTMVPSVTLGGNQKPLLRELGLGDAINFAATSNLDPADPDTGAPGLQVKARITGWTLTPPGENQDEQVALSLGALVGQISTGTVS